MRLKVLFYSFFLSLSLIAQTYIDVTHQYIKNPSFEEYYSCPESGSIPYHIWLDSCVGWYTPTLGTSDYFNSCSNSINNIVSVPFNTLVGKQYPFQGDGFCGIVAYALGVDNKLWCEYIQTELKEPLVENKTYKFTMRVNRANGYNLSVQNIGAHFSSTSISHNNTSPFNFNPTIINQTGYLNDTLNWTLIKGEFIANGGEKFLTIGWFGDTITSDFTFFIPPDIDSVTGDSLYLTETYYVVDSLNLYELNIKDSLDINCKNINDFNINVFTPNNDGVNDVIDFTKYCLNKFEFYVYNRWGVLVYSSNNPELIWDGRNAKNQKLKDGTYFYIINVTTLIGKEVNIQNSITIIN